MFGFSRSTKVMTGPLGSLIPYLTAAALLMTNTKPPCQQRPARFASNTNYSTSSEPALQFYAILDTLALAKELKKVWSLLNRGVKSGLKAWTGRSGTKCSSLRGRCLPFDIYSRELVPVGWTDSASPKRSVVSRRISK